MNALLEARIQPEVLAFHPSAWARLVETQHPLAVWPVRAWALIGLAGLTPDPITVATATETTDWPGPVLFQSLALKDDGSPPRKHED